MLLSSIKYIVHILTWGNGFKEKLIIGGLLMVAVTACSGGSEQGSSSGPAAKAEVQVQHVQTGAIQDSVKLVASIYFLKKNQVTAPFNGYIQKALVTQGSNVKRGQKLFTMQTREAKVLGEAAGDSLGQTVIDAPASGQVISVLHFSGDYVQQGTTLAKIIYPDDVYLRLFVPFKYQPYIKTNTSIPVVLPDGTHINATVNRLLSRSDSASQTAIYLLKPQTKKLLPEGLRVSAYPTLQRKQNTQILPKDAVLSNTTLDSFWVMQVLNDTLAVKVPIKKGIETEKQIEILSPEFKSTDRIITYGQYGLEDSALVKVVQSGGSSQ